MPLLRNQGQMLIRKAHCLLAASGTPEPGRSDPERAEGPSHISKGGQSPRAVVSQILGHCVHGFIPVHINRSGNMEISMILNSIFLNVRIHLYILALLELGCWGHAMTRVGRPSSFQAFDTQQALCPKPGWWAGPWRMVLPHEL